MALMANGDHPSPLREAVGIVAGLIASAAIAGAFVARMSVHAENIVDWIWRIYFGAQKTHTRLDADRDGRNGGSPS